MKRLKARREPQEEGALPPSEGPRFRKAIFLLPNLFTASNLILGMLAMMLAFSDALAERVTEPMHTLPFVWSGRLILIAIFMDMMDGRVARATGATSRFGMEFDSMADLVSFGMAPAILLYLSVLRFIPFWGVSIAVFYVVCAAVRLARFNVQAAVEEKDRFMGLPSPAAAGLLASYVLVSRWEGWSVKGPIVGRIMGWYNQNVGMVESIFVPALVLLVAALMVSNISYPSMKKMNREKIKPITLAVVAWILFMMVKYAEFTFFILLILYMFWNLLAALLRGSLGRLRKHRTTRPS